MIKRNRIGRGFIVCLAILTGIGLWKTVPGRSPGVTTFVHAPQGIMGTTCTLAVATGARNEERARESLVDAERTLRAIEARMSSWLDDSEISRLNRATGSEEIPLSPQSCQVLRAALQAEAQTNGAFDVTCRPLIELWSKAARRGRLPTAAEIDAARSESSCGLIEVMDGGAVKHAAEARVDLGGIAKGYGIDQAVAVLRHSWMNGGLVDVGGDLFCFGSPDGEQYWSVEVKNPFGENPLGQLHLRDRAACTSGNYARYTTIEGERYSHIVDPRTGWPSTGVPSVTVVSSSAMVADIWATALSVLGEDGLALLPDGVEALMVLGTAEDYRFVTTPGMPPFLVPTGNSK
ncbi:MAG: FAD:protein FMN transferase [Candidatus Eisenbacteria sp.]|nr:FAD:protein FMN transferase [Candidatus Eisenbacteria bacterium]